MPRWGNKEEYEKWKTEQISGKKSQPEKSNKQTTDPQKKEPDKKTKPKLSIIHWIGIVLAGLIVLIVIFGEEPKKNKKPVKTAAHTAKKVRPAKDFMEITDFSWKGDFSAKFTVNVRNNSSKNIKDVRFATYYYSKSKTTIDSGKETIYEIFPAGITKTVTFEEIKHPQAQSAGIAIIDAIWEWEKGKSHLDW